jgi:uncharacterized protein (TIGR02284 family)
MASHDERAALMHLIEVCRDEELMLRYVADHIRDPSMKTLLSELALQRAQFAQDLAPWVQPVGGTAMGHGSTRAAMSRRWMAIKDALLGHSDQRLIREVEHMESAALAEYERALQKVPITAREVVERQAVERRFGYERLNSTESVG